MKAQEPTRYWIFRFGWHGYEKYLFKKPMTRDEVLSAMDPKARADREYRYGKMEVEPVTKSRFYAL